MASFVITDETDRFIGGSDSHTAYKAYRLTITPSITSPENAPLPSVLRQLKSSSQQRYTLDDG